MALEQVLAYAYTGADYDPTPDTESVDVGSGADRVAFILVGHKSTTGFPSSITSAAVGSQTLTKSTTAYLPYDDWEWKLFYDTLTVSGSQVIHAVYGNSNVAGPHLMVLVCRGVNATTELENYAANGDADGDTNWSRSVNSAAGDLAVLMMRSSSTRTATASNGTVASGTGIGAGTQFHIVTRPGQGGSTTLSGTWDSGAYTDVDVVFSIKAAGSGGAAIGAAMAYYAQL